MLLRSPSLAHPAVRDVADQPMLETEGGIARDGRAILGNHELSFE
jgi:hypothetical protein